jgi:pimeloyl-ACP methyl ester carboxylesterase
MSAKFVLSAGVAVGSSCLMLTFPACRAPLDTTPHEVSFAGSGAALFGDVHPSAEGAAGPVVLLFHQGGGDARGEYGAIIPRLVERGFNVVAFDLPGGGNRFGIENRTVASRPVSQPTYCDDYGDLEAALAWVASSRFTGPRILWGSSYSAALAIRLAAEHPERVAAVLAFSPAGSGPMEGCRPDPHLTRLAAPLLVLRPTAELGLPAVLAQSELVRQAGHEVYEAVGGTHGSSMLVADRATGDVEVTWTRVLSFVDAALERANRD